MLLPQKEAHTSTPLMPKEQRSRRAHIMNIGSNSLPKTRQLWIGKLEVRPLKGSHILGDAKGAFVNVVTWACDAEEFRRNADLVLGELRLFILEVEDAEPVSTRREKAMFEDAIEDMVARAQENPNAIIYGTFHTWDRDSA